MKLQQAKLGFTLIELLVVITIIGILATGAVTTFTAQIQKARDTTRISDMKSLQGGIEQFYQDDTTYPEGRLDWVTGGTTVMDYLPTLAQDPKHNQTCNGSQCGYVYVVGADSVGIIDGAYEVSTAFENEGNRAKKAVSTVDNGEDENRFEVGTIKTGTSDADFDTKSIQGTAFDTADAAADSSTIVIIKSNVTLK